MLQFIYSKILPIIVIATNFSSANLIASALNEYDVKERKGKLYPARTRVTSYEFGSSNEENQEHVWHVSQNYLGLVEDWDLSKPIPRILARAIGASFTWINHIQPELMPQYEPRICRLIKAGLLNMSDLWIEGLPRTETQFHEQGLMQIIDPGPLQFNQRLFSQFEGDALFIGGTHNDQFSPLQYFTLDSDYSQNPDVIGNAMNISHIKAFPSDKFREIIFDHIAHLILLNDVLLVQYARILKQGGILVFKTEHAPQEYLEEVWGKFERSSLQKRLKEIGLDEVEIIKQEESEETPYQPYYILVNAYKAN